MDLSGRQRVGVGAAAGRSQFFLPIVSCPGRARAGAAAPTLVIAKPIAGATVHGVYSFAAALNPSGIPAAVEFDIGSKRLGISHRPPFTVAWNTGYAADGTYAVEAVARNAFSGLIITGIRLTSISQNLIVH